MKDYECVLDYTRRESRHPVGQEVTIRLRDPDTFEVLVAKAFIRSSFEDYPDADRVFYVSATKGRESDPVPLEIVEFIEEEEEEVRVLPKQKLTLGQRKGTMLADMIKERGEKKKK
jgi:hypothetical protein